MRKLDLGLSMQPRSLSTEAQGRADRSLGALMLESNALNSDIMPILDMRNDWY